MESRTRELDPHDWQALVGKWAIDASNAMLPGEEIGQAELSCDGTSWDNDLAITDERLR